MEFFEPTAGAEALEAVLGSIHLETHEELAARVCTLAGPGRLQCWACPVKTCEAWQDPESYLGEASRETALKAADRLLDNRTYVQGGQVNQAAREVGREETAFSLLMQLPVAQVQADLKVQMAAEAVLQGLFPEVLRVEEKVYKTWIDTMRYQVPTVADQIRLDEALAQAAARVVADRYEADREQVAYRIAYLRGFKLKGSKRG